MVEPEVLNARGDMVKEGTKDFERLWVVVYPAPTFVNLVVVGFGAVRFQWPVMPFWLTFPGIFMFVASSQATVFVPTAHIG